MMKTTLYFYAAACTAVALCSLPQASATAQPEFEILRTIEFESPFDTTAIQGFHLALDPGDGESFLAVPGELYRFEGPLTETTPFDSIDPKRSLVWKVYLAEGRLFFLSGYAKPEVRLYLFSDDGGRAWTSVEEQFYAEHTTQKGTLIQDWFPITWMQERNGLLYSNAGGGENVFVSADNGETWEVMVGRRETMVAAMGSRLVTDEHLFAGGEAPLDHAWIRRWPISEDGRTVTGEREQILHVGNANVMAMAEDPRTRSLFAGAEGRILRSDNRGDTFEYVLLPNDPALGGEGRHGYPYSYFQYLWVCPDYAGRILAGGFIKNDLDVVLLYSDADGTPGSWTNLSHGLTPHGLNLAFIEQDADGRILVGTSEMDAEFARGRSGTLTVAELTLPDPVRDRYPRVQRLGDGWWRDDTLGKFNAQWYPHQWHADWRGWAWNAEAAVSGGHALHDAHLGWLWMGEDLFPYVWHFDSGEFVRLAPGRPDRVFQRYEDGNWVDIEGGDGE